MDIANDATGTMEIGNYTGVLHAEYTKPSGRKGRVTGFKRKRQSVWSLVGAFLKVWGHTKHVEKLGKEDASPAGAPADASSKLPMRQYLTNDRS